MICFGVMLPSPERPALTQIKTDCRGSLKNGSMMCEQYRLAATSGAHPAALMSAGADGIEPSLAQKLAYLREPSAYSGESRPPQAIETHMSWVFLTDTLVYKLKKPVRFDFLDFSTLEARRQNCENELRLNRRLAPDIYIGVVPLTRLADGQLQLGGDGPVVDWLVKMHRLPAERMLDAAIRDGTVHPDDVRRLGDVLSRFYQQAEKIAVSPEDYCRRIEQAVHDNETHLCRDVYALDHAAIARLTRFQLEFITRQGAQLAQRVHDGRIVEAHGDLRPEHICLLPTPVVIDSLEFKREFRTQDVADELAYLALECERLGDAAIGEQLLQHYRHATGDTPDPALIAFYKIFRACLRAKIALWHIVDPALNNPQHWRQRAHDYLALALRYVSST